MLNCTFDRMPCLLLQECGPNIPRSPTPTLSFYSLYPLYVRSDKNGELTARSAQLDPASAEAALLFALSLCPKRKSMMGAAARTMAMLATTVEAMGYPRLW